jgi:hypothetical protein
MTTSPPAREPRGCGDKIRFPSHEKAQKAVDKLARKGRGYARAYECPHCDKWHLTSMPLLVWGPAEEKSIWSYLWHWIKRLGPP